MATLKTYVPNNSRIASVPRVRDETNDRKVIEARDSAGNPQATLLLTKEEAAAVTAGLKPSVTTPPPVAKPVAKFSYVPTTVYAGQTEVVFEGAASQAFEGKTIKVWHWNFDNKSRVFDNAASILKFTFLTVGIKQIELRVEDSNGVLSDPFVMTVTVVAPTTPPVTPPPVTPPTVPPTTPPVVGGPRIVSTPRAAGIANAEDRPLLDPQHLAGAKIVAPKKGKLKGVGFLFKVAGSSIVGGNKTAYGAGAYGWKQGGSVEASAVALSAGTPDGLLPGSTAVEKTAQQWWTDAGKLGAQAGGLNYLFFTVTPNVEAGQHFALLMKNNHPENGGVSPDYVACHPKAGGPHCKNYLVADDTGRAGLDPREGGIFSNDGGKTWIHGQLGSDDNGCYLPVYFLWYEGDSGPTPLQVQYAYWGTANSDSFVATRSSYKDAWAYVLKGGNTGKVTAKNVTTGQTVTASLGASVYDRQKLSDVLVATPGKDTIQVTSSVAVAASAPDAFVGNWGFKEKVQAGVGII